MPRTVPCPLSPSSEPIPGMRPFSSIQASFPLLTHPPEGVPLLKGGIIKRVIQITSFLGRQLYPPRKNILECLITKSFIYQGNPYVMSSLPEMQWVISSNIHSNSSLFPHITIKPYSLIHVKSPPSRQISVRNVLAFLKSPS